jgi:hypothetical protein
LVHCKSVPVQPIDPSAHRQIGYRVQYFDPQQDRSDKFRLRIAAGAEAPMLVEISGFTGRAVAVAASWRGAARLVLTRERAVVDGADDPQFWQRWTGVPLSGSLLHALLVSGEALQVAAGWSVTQHRSDPRGGAPALWELTDGERRLRLEKISESALANAPQWPTVPASYRLVAGGVSDDE